MEDFIKLLFNTSSRKQSFFNPMEKWVKKEKFKEVVNPIKTSIMLVSGKEIVVNKKIKGFLWWKKEYEEEKEKEVYSDFPCYLLKINYDYQVILEIYFPDTDEGIYNLNTYMDYLKKELNLTDFDLVSYNG